MVEAAAYCAFNSSLEHLFAELKGIEMRLQLQVLQAQSRDGFWDKKDIRGLYVSEKELLSLLTDSSEKNTALDADNPAAFPQQQILENLVRLQDQIKLRKKDSLHLGTELRLERLVSTFGLSPSEKDILLLALLPELYAKNERILGYIQDDVTRKNPSVGLALDLLYFSEDERVAGRHIFLPQSPLLKYKLISLHDDTPRRHASLLAHSIKIDNRICEYLLGSDEIDTALLPFVDKTSTLSKLDNLILPDILKSLLVLLAGSTHTGGQPLTFYFCGEKGSGRNSMAQALCQQLGIKHLLYTDIGSMLNSMTSFENATSLLCREALLQSVPLYWDNFDTLFGDSMRSQLAIALAAMEQNPGTVFLAGNKPWDSRYNWQSRRILAINFDRPDYKQRHALWQSCLDGNTEFPQELVDSIASKFQLNGGQIRAAVAAAQNLAILRDGGVITEEELYQACRQQSSQKLTQLARKIKPKYIWDDIVLPRDQLEQLKELCSYVKYHQLVYGTWGFSHKAALGRGLNALFTGSSGTGKTMAAEIVASELGIDLYKIDLATVVSKYVGETEKNLDRIFQEAQDSNAILFFDEADAIFGKRSEVRDSHDRYANIEIAYLLQKMEDYQGIVILATNFRKNLDEAFARRMHFSLEFPLPEEPDRYLIWQKAFPTSAPLAKDINLLFMAKQFRISGGNIKNIVLSAAFLAAQDAHKISMRHLILATRREFQKMGKLCTESDFAQYFEMVKP